MAKNNHLTKEEIEKRINEYEVEIGAMSEREKNVLRRWLSEAGGLKILKEGNNKRQ